MTCKSLCGESLFMFAMAAGQTTELNGLNFSEEAHGYP